MKQTPERRHKSRQSNLPEQTDAWSTAEIKAEIDRTLRNLKEARARELAASIQNAEEGTPEAEAEPETREVELLDRQLRQAEEAVGEVVPKHHRAGPAATEIITVSEEIGAGLIVMGSRGLIGLERMAMGSVSESVVRHAHCPVMVVRQKSEQE